MGKILWLTGNSGAGKTTLAQEAKRRYSDIVVLDGDEMRDSISIGLGFSKKDREENNLRVARLARILASQGFLVVIAVIAPFRSTRAKIDKICSPIWIHLDRDLPEDINKPYEKPSDPDYILTPDKTFKAVKDFAKIVVEEYNSSN